MANVKMFRSNAPSRPKYSIVGIAVVGLILCSVGVIGQGSVNFANIGVGLNSPFFDTDGVTRLEGADFLAQLFVSPADASSDSELTAVAGTAMFQTDENAEYFLGGVRVVGGSTAVFHVRVWTALNGDTFRHGKNPIGGVMAPRGRGKPLAPPALQIAFGRAQWSGSRVKPTIPTKSVHLLTGPYRFVVEILPANNPQFHC